MNTSTKIWLKYSILGLIASFSLVALIEAVPSIRIFSNEGAVFGVMIATMHLAIKKAVNSTKQSNNDCGEYSNANQQS